MKPRNSHSSTVVPTVYVQNSVETTELLYRRASLTARSLSWNDTHSLTTRVVLTIHTDPTAHKKGPDESGPTPDGRFSLFQLTIFLNNNLKPRDNSCLSGQLEVLL
ncbi:hypothetical protein N9Y42_04550 [Mariniblastus sp.]|nr:hypothetical protein [Mariniblastus sp.]